MDGIGGHYAKWKKSEKDNYHMTSLIHGILKVQQTIEHNREREASQI